ncbi:MAG: transposase, partial [Acidimicrobiales bacterium]|nr:transposase [Acidimicrobiales bacterium]
PGLEFRFPTATCATCPLRDQCVGGATGRRIFVGRHHDRMAAARAAQAEPATKALLRQRSKIERKIDHLQDLGMRQARYRGRRKTRLQALLAATVANFKRLGVLGAFEAQANVAIAA